MASPTDSLLVTACVIHHVENDATARDEYGNITTDATTTTSRCYLAQQSRTENNLDNIERERWAGYFPATDLIDANDAVTVGGDEYQVVGQPWAVVDPVTGTVDHLEATLELRR